MKTRPLSPARIDFDGPAPRSREYGDVYHPAEGAGPQLQHVFLGGNDLPSRWQGKRRFSILETGFGLGHNFLGTWAAWEQDPQRSERLEFVSLELHPPSREDLLQAHRLHASSPPHLVSALAQAWPPLTPGLHRLNFGDGRVSLTLGYGDGWSLLPAIVGRFDAFFLDGFAPATNPRLWDARLLRALARLARPGASAATWSAARAVREGLRSAGFIVERAPGPGRKRHMTRARFEPDFVPRSAPGRPGTSSDTERRAMVVGAGLAGAAVAATLAQHGWQCTVLERAPRPAHAASGNPAGLFHGALHLDDGPHARLHRAAALHAARHFGPLLASGRVPGSLDGLLALRPDGTAWPATSPDYACQLSANQAQHAAGVSVSGPALLYRQGGWISPAALVDVWLSTPGVTLRTDVDVRWIRRPCRLGEPWAVGDDRGRAVAEAPVLVLCAGIDLPALARSAGFAVPGASVVRGQLQWSRRGPSLRRPLTGHGYALAMDDGRLVFGAASRADDATASILSSDTAWNLQRLHDLTGHGSEAEGGDVHGRVGFRLGLADRLPMVGAVPARTMLHGSARGFDQVRLLPREPGLFVAGAFGSRGLSWAPLAADILLGWLEGTTMPLEADLLDAVDPARAWVRLQRSATRN